MALSRWLAPATLAAALGAASLAPKPAQAQSMDDLMQVIVNVADVAFRGGQPYYRYGDYGQDDRLIMRRDRYGRPVYYRVVQDGRYNTGYNTGAPYGRAYGYYNNRNAQPSRVKCNPHGKCKAEYYDARYDRRGYAYGDRRWRDD